MDSLSQEAEGDKLSAEHNMALEALQTQSTRFKPNKALDELLIGFKFRQKLKEEASTRQDSPSAVEVSFAPPVYAPCLTPLREL